MQLRPCVAMAVYRLAAVTQPLPWKLPYAASAALKRKKKKSVHFNTVYKLHLSPKMPI